MSEEVIIIPRKELERRIEKLEADYLKTRFDEGMLFILRTMLSLYGKKDDKK